MKRPNVEQTLDKIISTILAGAMGIQRLYHDAANPKVEKIGGRLFRLEPLEPTILADEILAAQSKIEERINAIIEDYSAQESEFQTLRGSDLTDDQRLFDSGFSLAKQDLDTLAAKYLGNYTMHSAIVDYGRGLGITIVPLQSVQSRVDVVNGFWKKARPRFFEYNSALETPIDGPAPETRMTGTIDALEIALGHFKANALEKLY